MKSKKELRTLDCILCNVQENEISVSSKKIIYGSVSAGREFWPFRVIFFQKVECSCGQTVKDRFDFSIDSGQLYLVHSGDLNLALDNKEEEEEGGNNDEEKEEDKTNNKKEMLRIWIFSAGNSG